MLTTQVYCCGIKPRKAEPSGNRPEELEWCLNITSCSEQAVQWLRTWMSWIIDLIFIRQFSITVTFSITALFYWKNNFDRNVSPIFARWTCGQSNPLLVYDFFKKRPVLVVKALQTDSNANNAARLCRRLIQCVEDYCKAKSATGRAGITAM